MSRKVLWLLLLGAVCLAVGVLFSIGITGDHISMDDWGYIYGCPFVRGGLTAGNLLRAFTEIGYDAFWMPLTYVTYMCDITLFGGGWIVHHSVNVALHVLNTVAAFFLLRTLLVSSCAVEDRRASVLAIAAVFLWAVHPMRAEAVTYVASRKELLWSLFAMGGLLAWMGFLSTRRRGAYAAAVLGCLLACLSKPTAVCFPILAYILEAVRTKRLRPAAVGRYAPFLIIAGVVGCLVLYAQGNPIDHERLDVFGETFSWRLLNACVGFGMYVWHTLVPSQAYFDYRAVFGGRPLDLELGLAMLGLFALAVALAFVALRRDENRRWGLLGLFAWFFVALLPVSGIMGTVNGDHAYADRYTYLPFVGVLGLVVLVAANAPKRVLRALLALSAVAALGEICVAPGVIRSYRNDFTAFSRTLRFDPDHWRALRVVGNECCARLGKMDEGVAMLERSVVLRPSQRTADSLAYVLAIRGKAGDFGRVRELGAGVARSPRKDAHGMMLDALGTVNFREGKDAEAVKCYYASLKAPGRNYSNHHTILNLALALANCGRGTEAADLLARLARSRSPGVRACCERTLARLKAGDRPRFSWRADPFAVSAGKSEK